MRKKWTLACILEDGTLCPITGMKLTRKRARELGKQYQEEFGRVVLPITTKKASAINRVQLASYAEKPWVAYLVDIETLSARRLPELVSPAWFATWQGILARDPEASKLKLIFLPL